MAQNDLKMAQNSPKMAKIAQNDQNGQKRPQKCQTVKKWPFFPPQILFFLDPLGCRTKGYPLVLHALLGLFGGHFPHKYCSFWPILAPIGPSQIPPPKGGPKTLYRPIDPPMGGGLYH